MGTGNGWLNDVVLAIFQFFLDPIAPIELLVAYFVLNNRLLNCFMVLLKVGMPNELLMERPVSKK